MNSAYFVSLLGALFYNDLMKNPSGSDFASLKQFAQPRLSQERRPLGSGQP
jgi:hypothetical protein